MQRVQATYRRRRWRWRYLPEAVPLPSGRYDRHAHLFWRVRIPLFVGLAVLGWLAWRSRGVIIGLVVAALVEALFSYRRHVAGRPAPTHVASGPAQRDANYWRALKPSPAGWESPRGAIPMWNWTPPGGGHPRLDRVRPWVRAWYHTPFIDRYAHAWMWRHGGWDVLPPSYNSE